MTDDETLLREYVERRSERAFAELVARYLPLVHGVAARVVGERQAAQDVAQGVFIQLARKAWMVRTGGALPGWLYRAAHRDRGRIRISPRVLHRMGREPADPRSR